MNNCIIITNEFPFLNGEPFLQNELKYLSKTFDNIYIFSINSNGEEKMRQVPNNTFVFSLNGTHSKAKYIKYVLHGIKNKNLLVDNTKMKRMLADLYVKGRAMDTAEKISRIVDSHNIDMTNAIVYSFWFSYQALAACLIKEKYRKLGNNIFAISRAHGYDLYWERNRLKYCPYQEYMINSLDCVFPCSEHGRNYLLDKYGWAKNKIMTSRLGTIDYGVVKIGAYEKKTLITCSNLIPLKRIDLFARAFVLIASKDPNLKWLCIGDGEEKQKIETIVYGAGLRNQVIFLGQITNAEVINIYKTADVNYLCNVSEYEGIPVSMMEALSFGVPVIATNVGGVEELVNDRNGLLIEKDISEEQLAYEIENMLNISLDEYLDFRNFARITWEKYFSAEKNYIKFCESLNKLYNS